MKHSTFRYGIIVACLFALVVALPVAAAPTSSSKTSTAKPAVIDINSATKAQLMTLPGMTAARANKIIAGRPFKTTNELVTKKILTATTYKQISKRMVARPVATVAAASPPVTIPAGTKIAIRLIDPIDSAVNKTGDTFRASLDAPMVVDGKEVVPKHADVTGRVVSVESAGHFTGRSELGLVLSQVTAGDRTFTIKTQALAKAGSSRGVRSAVVIGGGAAAGALIGAIAGGGKGAAIGAAAGAGAGTGVQALTKSEQVQFPSETLLEFELQEATTSTPTPSAATPANPPAVTRTFDETPAASTDSSTAVQNVAKAKDTLASATTAAAAVAPAIAIAPAPDVSKTAPSTPSTAPSLTADRITAGLKEALAIGTGNAVALTGKPDGFLGNPAIRIPLPEQLKSLGSGARYLGMGSQVDQLETGMNRAAEQAAPQAKKIFLEALTKMSFADARKIWSGGDTAATEYFKDQTTSQLAAAFKPIVHAAMENVGVVKQYNAIAQNPLAGSLGLQGFNFDDYVVGKSLSGLFYMLGEEEKKIRKEPLAQTTSLLKEVFGRRP